MAKMAKVDARPTKEFFISMLTRDIKLTRAIVDLIDNSVDAARNSGNLTNKEIQIEINEQFFRIKDSCGGIPIDVATKYAFRFGRHPNAPQTPHSLGRFGVGMKRALFKIGNKFSVTSHHQDNSFKIEVDVEEWVKDKNWEFDLKEIIADNTHGTTVEVTNLHPNNAEQFSLDSTLNDLEEEVSQAHFEAINQGLSITLNNKSVTSHEIKIISDNITCLLDEEEIDGVKVKYIVGIGEREYESGGWNIICNGRLIESKEQSKLTGWGDKSQKIPKYHPDYAFFRGVVSFECNESGKLPWTTTKTGVDSDNKVYRRAKLKMQSIMKEVLPFLKSRTNEEKAINDGDIQSSQIVDAVKLSEDPKHLVNIFEANYSNAFEHPDYINLPAPQDRNTKIAYSIPTKKLSIAKTYLGVSTNKDVGLETFNYYFDNECDDE